MKSVDIDKVLTFSAFKNYQEAQKVELRTKLESAPFSLEQLAFCFHEGDEEAEGEGDEEAKGAESIQGAMIDGLVQDYITFAPHHTYYNIAESSLRRLVNTELVDRTGNFFAEEQRGERLSIYEEERKRILEIYGPYNLIVDKAFIEIILFHISALNGNIATLTAPRDQRPSATSPRDALSTTHMRVRFNSGGIAGVGPSGGEPVLHRFSFGSPPLSAHESSQASGRSDPTRGRGSERASRSHRSAEGLHPNLHAISFSRDGTAVSSHRHDMASAPTSPRVASSAASTGPSAQTSPQTSRPADSRFFSTPLGPVVTPPSLLSRVMSRLRRMVSRHEAAPQAQPGSAENGDGPSSPSGNTPRRG